MVEPSHGEARDFFQKIGFKPITKETYLLLKEFEHDSILVERTALVTVTWVPDHNGLYMLIRDHLCCVLFYERRPVYFVIYRPGADGSEKGPLKAVINDLFEMLRGIRLPSLQIRYIDEESLDEFRAIPGYTVKTEYSDNDSEYVLKTTDFIDLSGNINKYKRGHINKILKNTNLELRPLDRENIRVCTAIETEWCQSKVCEICRLPNGCEKRAVDMMVRLFDEGRIGGYLLFQDNAPIGYNVVEKRNNNISFGLFGKTLGSIPFVYLAYITVKDYLSDVEFVNIDADMGLSGLRTFKQHLGPFSLERKYICSFSKPEDNRS
jgi:hypothetical protein